MEEERDKSEPSVPEMPPAAAEETREMGIPNSAAKKEPAVYGQTEIQIGGKGFYFLYFVFALLITTAMVVGTVGLLAFLIPVVTGLVVLPDIVGNLGVIATRDAVRIAALGSGKGAGAGGVAAFGILVALALAAVTLVLFWLLRGVKKARTHRETVPLLLPAGTKNFFLGTEGIYTLQFGNRFTGGRWYRFRPWESLHLSVLDEKKGRIGLVHGIVSLRLVAGKGAETRRQNFRVMKDIVLDHLPAERRAVPARLRALRRGVTVAVLGVLFLSNLAAAGYLESLSGSKVGDRVCDVCSRRAAVTLTGVSTVDGGSAGEELLHEYCLLHGTVSQIIHPFTAVKSVVRVLVPAVKQLGFSQAMLAAAASPLLLTLDFVLIFYWFVSLLALVFYLEL